ncbi:MAG TPA: glutamyl-tRNA reductase [Candidatus Acidoferrales bacterium]|nr:glutamyl-tRNA reductase [Candidatus Acidoferrales bacterium]
MSVFLLGLNHRTAAVALRERLHFSPQEGLRAAESLRREGLVQEVVVLSTCNRSEVYAVAEEAVEVVENGVERHLCEFHAVDAAQLNGCLYRRRGRDAVEHLYRVAAGLDSMLLGEAEILGQVRETYLAAQREGLTGPVLNRLFQASLEVGKRVRSETRLGAQAMSVPSAAMKLAEQIFGELKDNSAVVLGAGAMGAKAARQLRTRGIGRLWVANRTPERARELAAQTGGQWAAWEKSAELLAQVDIVVTSVAGDDWTLSREALAAAMHARGNRRMFLIDLGVPRNIDPAAAELYNVFLYGVDDLQDMVQENRHARESEVPRAEAIVLEHVDKFTAWQSGASAVSTLAELRNELRLRRELFTDARSEELGRFSPEERERILHMMDDLVEHLLREPAERLMKDREVRERAVFLRDLFGLHGTNRPGPAGRSGK